MNKVGLIVNDFTFRKFNERLGITEDDIEMLISHCLVYAVGRVSVHLPLYSEDEAGEDFPEYEFWNKMLSDVSTDDLETMCLCVVASARNLKSISYRKEVGFDYLADWVINSGEVIYKDIKKVKRQTRDLSSVLTFDTVMKLYASMAVFFKYAKDVEKRFLYIGNSNLTDIDDEYNAATENHPAETPEGEMILFCEGLFMASTTILTMAKLSNSISSQSFVTAEIAARISLENMRKASWDFTKKSNEFMSVIEFMDYVCEAVID